MEKKKENRYFGNNQICYYLENATLYLLDLRTKLCELIKMPLGFATKNLAANSVHIANYIFSVVENHDRYYLLELLPPKFPLVKEGPLPLILRSNSCMNCISNYIYLINAGSENYYLFNQTAIYDFAKDKWIKNGPELNQLYRFIMACSFNNRFLYVIGINKENSNIEKLDALDYENGFKIIYKLPFQINPYNFSSFCQYSNIDCIIINCSHSDELYFFILDFSQNPPKVKSTSQKIMPENYYFFDKCILFPTFYKSYLCFTKFEKDSYYGIGHDRNIKKFILKPKGNFFT